MSHHSRNSNHLTLRDLVKLCCRLNELSVTELEKIEAECNKRAHFDSAAALCAKVAMEISLARWRTP